MPLKVTHFKLMLLVRNSRLTSGSERLLLDALVLRCAPEKAFSCFPSYSRLAEDTGLDANTLKRAAKRLEDRGLIQRKVRSNQSNYWYINVAMIKEAADKCAAAAIEAELAAKGLDDCPFPNPVDGLTDESMDRLEPY